MDEREFRRTYAAVNQRRCHFEKALNSRVFRCAKSHRFHLADREGVACRSPAGHRQCAEALRLLREKARFALGRADTSLLPHGHEIKVQNGGLAGIGEAVEGNGGHTPAKREENPDVYDLLSAAAARFGDFETLPFGDIVRAIRRYEGRRRRRKRK